MRVVAPISGTVDAVGLTLGEPAQPGMTTIRVVNLSDMKIVTKVADTYINTVRKGDQAEVTLGSGEKMTGRVSFVGKVVNPRPAPSTWKLPSTTKAACSSPTCWQP
jgi:multidrug resistance efflux pump